MRMWVVLYITRFSNDTIQIIPDNVTLRTGGWCPIWQYNIVFLCIINILIIRSSVQFFHIPLIITPRAKLESPINLNMHIFDCGCKVSPTWMLGEHANISQKSYSLLCIYSEELNPQPSARWAAAPANKISTEQALVSFVVPRHHNHKTLNKQYEVGAAVRFAAYR